MTAEEFKKLTSEYFEAAQKFVEENKKERGVIVMTTYEKTDDGNSTRGVCATPVIAASMIGSAKKDGNLRPVFLVVDMMEKLGM
jgi:hypothetical protein